MKKLIYIIIVSVLLISGCLEQHLITPKVYIGVVKEVSNDVVTPTIFTPNKIGEVVLGDGTVINTYFVSKYNWRLNHTYKITISYTDDGYGYISDLQYLE